MIQIRNNVFETNSSSTHSITMCMKNDYIKWKTGKVWFIDSGSCRDNPFFTFEDMMEFMIARNIFDSDAIEKINNMRQRNDEEGLADYLRDYDVYTFDTYFDNEYEEFYDEFTTPNSSETICAFGYYGESY